MARPVTAQVNPKEMPSHAWIGLMFFIAAVQFVIALIVAETRYPGYNAGAYYISDLGPGLTPLQSSSIRRSSCLEGWSSSSRG
jgi:hypothetical protein